MCIFNFLIPGRLGYILYDDCKLEKKITFYKLCHNFDSIKHDKWAIIVRSGVQHFNVMLYIPECLCFTLKKKYKNDVRNFF